MIKIKKIFLFLVLGSHCILHVQGATEVKNGQELIRHFSLESYEKTPSLASLKIAVLDNGFMGFQPKENLLPDSTELIANYPKEFLERFALTPQVAGNPLAPTPHGLRMAQIVWEMTGKDPLGPKFFLLNAHGLTQFRRAVQYAINEKVDIILYSQNWEYGGNFDGRGFINQVVSEATQAGILWVNAAGNYGQSVYDSSIQIKQVAPQQKDLALPGPFNILRLQNKIDENPFNITLSWNDFADQEDYQSQKDLDLFLYNEKNELIASSKKAQGNKNDPERPFTAHARERIDITLERGFYYLKIQPKSDNFEAKDRLRVTIQSERPMDSFEFIDRTSAREVMIPADHPHVITVGDFNSYSAKGPTLDGRNKPDFHLDSSRVQFTNGFTTEGTSNAAAIFTGIAAKILSVTPANIKINNEKIFKTTELTCPPPSVETAEKLWKEIPTPIIKVLEELKAIDLKTLRPFLTKEGKIALPLEKDPLQLSYLFSNVVTYASYYSLPSQSFRYFLAPKSGQLSLNSSSSPWQQIESAFFLKTKPASLPQNKKWIELVHLHKDQGNILELCPQLLKKWKTPAPFFWQ